MMMFKFLPVLLLALDLAGAIRATAAQEQDELGDELILLLTEEEELADLQLQLFQDRLLSGEESAHTEFEEHFMLSRRADEDCPTTLSGIDFFDIEIEILPQSVQSCPAADQVFLGNAINLLLLEYGVGDSGVNDGMAYLAGVCPEPETGTRRRLSFGGYVWNGGGGCRSCNPDNGDGRGRKLTSDWFYDQFKPQLEATLEAAIANELAPDHAGCLGANPKIDVTVVGIKLWQLLSALQCSSSTSGSGTLPLLETTGHSIWNLGTTRASCGECTKIDFNGPEVAYRDYVTNQYAASAGLEISVVGGYSPSNKRGPRIFDTSKPGTNNNNGDPDLGSPNKYCPGGGPGIGNGGKPNEEGENCIPIGNVLIIQESNKWYPDDSASGGKIVFKFNDPVRLSDIGMMDIDEKDQKMRFYFDDGSSSTYGYRGMGNNSVQRVVANKGNVVKLVVILPGSGAITELSFCEECSR